ncbi:Ammonium transporter [Candidatus Rhodobacter oscarellae]|uniref:Ammonium transporter n=2 Tax=Candidatus Rhodobacter oscarellae TaxID=1675527 RepID=A0A0J9E4V8_9RHOB|nr:Ammonium transporter [Candidatus Rhodobacter lobularis]
MEAKGGTTNTNFAEMYYYITIPIMIIIHAGFLAYEMGATRMKNVLSSGVKNILAFAFVIPAFYFFGWWLYWALPTGLSGSMGAMEISGVAYANSIAWGWGESAAYMGPNTGDQIDGVFWGAFALFAATTASIMSGALIERIQTVGFIICAIVLGGFSWVVAAAWGWHSDGWLVTQWGLHDFGAAGLVHAVAAFFAFGVLFNLGPRIGKFNDDGSSNDIGGHNMPFTITGLMLIIVGFWGFLMACVVPGGESWSWGHNFATIYGTPTNLGALAFNILMSIAGGIIGAWVCTKDPFWMMSGALAGIISCASGLDIYFPAQAFVIALVAGVILKPCADWLERTFKVDDAVGAVTVHGTIGIYGMLMLGIFASGYPAIEAEGAATTSFIGQLVGSVVFIILGFGTGWVTSFILKMLGMLRVPDQAQLDGLDPTKVPVQAYPEGIPTSPAPAE